MNKKNNLLNILNIPPTSIEVEQFLLGSLLLNNNLWNKISHIINKDCFYRYDHKIIFFHILKLINNSKPADIITVYESISNNGQSQEIGGIDYINFLIQNTPASSNIIYYAKIIKNKNILRKLIDMSNDIINSITQPKGKSVKKIINEIESKIFSIIKEKSKYNNNIPIKIKPLLKNIINYIHKMKNKKTNITGLSTGFKDLDKITSGFQKGDLIIIAGRPSMGKTAFAINIAENIALNTKLPVIIYSMEMSSKQLIIRILGSIAKIDQNLLRNGKLFDNDWINLSKTISKLNKTKIYIDDSSYITPMEIRSKSRRLACKYGKLGIIIIDYLQLMSSDNNFENRNLEISEISKNLKKLAKELNCPIVALSQLNRALEQRTNKRPIMSDLRESGALEQDADLILFIYRDEIYNFNNINKGITEIIIGKHRNGPIGIIKLLFIDKFTKYKNYKK